MKFVKVSIPLDENAIHQMESIINRWKASPGDDASLRKGYTQDRKDLRHVLSLYKKGEWQQAAEFSSSLDTMVREMIPDSIWNSVHDALP